MQDSLSIFARALASENLSFSFDSSAETAAFDVKNRHLVLPVWDVSETVSTMLVAHEIAHALWTPHQESEDILNAAEAQGYNKVILHRIANVIEDTRIEKLMKAKYPGTRRDFFLGYKEMIDKNMFGLAEANYDKMGLVNRVNIFFKWGAPGFVHVSLSDEERKIVDRIDNVQTFAEVYEIAKFLYDHPSMGEEIESALEKLKAQGNNGEQEAADGVAQDITGGIGKKDGETYVASSVTITPVKSMKNVIFSTDALLRQFEEQNEHNLPYLSFLKDYREFVKDSDSFVRQLALQFERRKAADEIRRERPKPTGMLNLDRLHQYRTHDDIFISKIVKQEGKNHGIVFLLDFSSSMASRLPDCILQLFQLVWFCEKVKIPFEVFAFTDVHAAAFIGLDKFNRAYSDWRRENPESYSSEFKHPEFDVEQVNVKATSVLLNNTRLLNLASSQDSAEKRERLMAFLYGALVRNTVSSPRSLRLGGTPTVEAVAEVTQFMQEWVAANNIQIPTFMLVTDGQPNSLCVKNDVAAKVFHHGSKGSLTVTNEILHTMERFNLAENANTSLPNLIIASMLNGMRTAMNARIVGMFVGPMQLGWGDYVSFCMSDEEQTALFNLPYHVKDSIANKSPRFHAMKIAYKEGAIITHPDRNPGFDTFFLVKTPKIVKDEDAIAESGTFTKIKNTFVKTMGSRSSSRVFLTRYVDIVAGQKIQKGLGGAYNLPAT